MRAAVQREANKLVEEFMLLANMSVAALVADAFPERALLRRHPPPNQRKLDEVSHLSSSLVRAPTRPTSTSSMKCRTSQTPW